MLATFCKRERYCAYKSEMGTWWTICEIINWCARNERFVGNTFQDFS